MSLAKAIRDANALLPGRPRRRGKIDPRWQAIIRIANSIEAQPDAVWRFVAHWGVHPQHDLRAAIATCLLEHLLEHHFSTVFPKVERLVRKSNLFAGTFRMCWPFGQAARSRNLMRFHALQRYPEKELPSQSS
jgi:hypothetical protein